jgi:hypothetical protein
MYRVAVIVLVGLFSVSALAANRVPKFDTDNDLHVNYVEITAKCRLSRQLFDLADKDDDNVLSEAEMRVARSYLFSKCKKESKDA